MLVCVGAGMRLSSRARGGCAVVAMWVALAVFGSHPAQAQSFFESLFGWGGGSKAAPPAAHPAPNQGRAGSGPIFTPGGFPYSAPASARSLRGDDDDDTSAQGEDSSSDLDRPKSERNMRLQAQTKRDTIAAML